MSQAATLDTLYCCERLTIVLAFGGVTLYSYTCEDPVFKITHGVIPELDCDECPLRVVGLPFVKGE